VSAFFDSKHMPCSECGASVARSDRDRHTCDPERLLDFRMFQLRGEVAAFRDELGAYLDSPAGRFAQWYAQRNRRGPSKDAADDAA
jgi:hypothetical protein